MRERIFDEIYIQNENPDEGLISIDYEKALGGKFLEIVEKVYEALRTGQRKPLVQPMEYVNDGITKRWLPMLTPFVSFAFQGYTSRKQSQRFIFVTGAQGAGKSALALKGGAYIYAINSMGDDDDPDSPITKQDLEAIGINGKKLWRQINYYFTLFHLFIDLRQFDKFLAFLSQYGLRAPYVIIDDAQVFFSKTVFLEDRALYLDIDSVMTLIRTQVMTTVMTLPVDISRLHTTLRDMEGTYKVTVNSPPSYDTIAHFPRINNRPESYSEYRIYKKTWRDHYVRYERTYLDYYREAEGQEPQPKVIKTYKGVFHVMLPQEFFEAYSEMRAKSIELVKEMKRKMARKEDDADE